MICVTERRRHMRYNTFESTFDLNSPPSDSARIDVYPIERNRSDER